jgi:transcriptional regulator with XRE-family HTH domain
MPEPAELQRHPLRLYRDKHNLRLADLAHRANLDISGLSRIETGATELPSCAVMLALASATQNEVGPLDIFRWHFHARTGTQAVAGTIGYQPPRTPPRGNPATEACGGSSPSP